MTRKSSISSVLFGNFHTKFGKPLKLVFVLVGVALIIFSSCKKEELFVGETDISHKLNPGILSDIPFADEQTLAAIASHPEKVPYLTARKLAVLEMELSINESMNWHGTRLSEKPVVIFDGHSRAKYYEFLVINESGEAIGTVTALAQRETDAVISHILPFVRDYSNLTIKGGNYRMISGGYPTRILLGIIGKSGEDVSSVLCPLTGETVDEVPSESAQGFIDALKALTEEQKEQMGIDDVGAVIVEAEQKDALNREHAMSYWGLIDTLEAELIAMSDEEIAAAITESKRSWTSHDVFAIPSYNTPGMRNTFWGGWCGPSALAWVYRGLYSSYNGRYLPLAGEPDFPLWPYRLMMMGGTRGVYYFGSKGDHDSDGRINSLDADWVNPISYAIDGGLYAKLADESDMYFWASLTGEQMGPVSPFGLHDALSNVSDNHIVSLTPFNLLSLTPVSHEYIRNTRLPVICLINGLSHWVVAFGSKYEMWNWQVVIRIFRRNVTLARGSIRTDKYLLIHDNGAEMSKHNYAPFWRNDKLVFDLQFPVIRN